MRGIVKFAVHNSMIVNITMAAIIIMGLFITYNTRREVFPTMTIDIIHVAVPFPGASAEEVEEGVTIKVEEAIQGVTGIDYIQSTSRENAASIMAYLRTDVKDTRKVLEDVRNKVDQIYSFPDDAEEPSIVQIEHTDEVIALVLYGDASQLTLKSLTEEVRDELQDLEQISNVSVMGLRDREMIIEVSEEALRRYRLTFDEVAYAVQSYDLDISSGVIKTQEEELSLRASSRNYRPETLEKITLRAAADGTNVLLRDVADVREEFEDINYELLYNGKPAMLIYVIKTEQEDSLKIAAAVKEYLKEKNPTLAAGLKIDIMDDSSKILNQRIQLLLKNGRYAVILIFIILMIFLGIRLSFWVAMGLPVACLGTMILLKTQDVTINMMSLFSFITVIGILVDDAIVVAENIQQHIEQGKSPMKAAVDGTVEVFPAVLASVTTTIVAFSPMLFIVGPWGKFMFPIACVAVMGLIVSLFESVFILPTHLGHSLRPISEVKTAKGFFAGVRRRTDAGIQWLINNTYKPVLRLTMKWNWGVVAVGFALFIISIGVVASGTIKFIFFPQMDSEYLTMSYTLEPGSSMAVHDRTVDHVLEMTEVLNEEFREKRRKFLKTKDGKKFAKLAGPDTEFVVRTYAVKGGGLQGGGSSELQGGVFVEVLGGEERGLPSRDVLNRWRELCGEMPGVDKVNFEATVGPPGTDEVEVMLVGESMDEIQKAAALLKKKLRDYDGVYQVYDDLALGRRELRMELNDRGKSLGLTLLDLARQVRQGFYGHEIHRVQRGRDEIKVWVRYPENERDSVADFEDIRIRTALGDEVPLSDVATVTVGRQLREISRYERRRRLTVKFKVDGEHVTPDEMKTEIPKIMPDILHQVHGVSFKIEGQNRWQRQMQTSMATGFQVALVVIFLIITLTFRNFLHAIMIMLLIPMGFVGAVFGHLVVPIINSSVERLDLTMLSMGGIVALAGIVVNDSIVMVHAIKRNIADGQSVRDSVFNGAVSRFRAIVLTTLTTSLGMMPLIMEKQLQAQFLIPMGASIAFGLLVSTFFTQVWLPGLFLSLNSLKRAWYFIAKGRMYTPEEIERNGLPNGNFIKGVIPFWMIAALVLALFVATIAAGIIKIPYISS